MTKDLLIAAITKILGMNRDELMAQAEAISLSDVDDTARKFLNRVIDMRIEEVRPRDIALAMVVSSELGLFLIDIPNAGKRGPRFIYLFSTKAVRGEPRRSSPSYIKFT